jgi:hypothetical protein
MARTLGSKDKPKRALIMRLKQIYGDEFDVVLKMAENATNIQLIADSAMDVLHEIIKEPGDTDATERVQICRGASSSAVEAINAWDKVAVYVQPKLKQVELTGEGGGAIDTHYTVEFIKPAVQATKDVDAEAEG